MAVWGDSKEDEQDVGSDGEKRLVGFRVAVRRRYHWAVVRKNLVSFRPDCSETLVELYAPFDGRHLRDPGIIGFSGSHKAPKGTLQFLRVYHSANHALYRMCGFAVPDQTIPMLATSSAALSVQLLNGSGE